ncbi:MAG: von Willebrand factor type A domain-containing protein [Gemmatimonadota bacterium]
MKIPLLLAGLFVAGTGPLFLTRPSPPPPAGAVIAGRVTDAAQGHPIEGARVLLEGTAVETLTRRNGTYVLELDAGVGALVLRVEAAGYETARRTLPTDGLSQRIDFALQAAAAPPVEEQKPERTLVDRILGRRQESEAGRAAPSPQATVGYATGVAQPMAADMSMAPGFRRTADPDDFNTEGYDHLTENPFRSVAADPLSTFSIDVDRASYANVRRFIENGTKPPIDAVRIEEMVNCFHYDYPNARGEHPFDVHTEVAPAPWNGRHHLVKIGLQGQKIDLEEVPPNNLVFLLDVSGSMSSPDKLPLLKQAFALLVNELRPQDRIAIVVYAGAAGLVLDSTPGSETETILRALESLEAGGSTAGGAGIRLAYDVARRNHIRGGNNRVILATDGDFNVGASSDGEMVRLIEEKRTQGTFLTVLGFGTGNLKDSKMEKLADHGNGNYAYIDSELEAKKVLVTELGGTLVTIAKDVKIQVEFNPERVQAYRLIGYENRLLANQDFNDDTKDAGELGAGHTVTALYEVVPVGVRLDVDAGSVDALRYQRPAESSVRSDSDELLFVKLRYKRPDGERSRLLEHPVEARVARTPSTDFRWAAAVAGFGMLLRESEHCGDFTLDDVLALARDARGDDAQGYRADFIRLVEAAELLGLMAER